MPRLVLLNLIRKRRPRSRQAHVSVQHIEKWRKLVDTRFANNSANPRDPWVRCQLVQWLLLGPLITLLLPALDKPRDVFSVNTFLHVEIHGSELIDGKQSSPLSHASLLKESGSWRAQSYD